MATQSIIAACLLKWDALDVGNFPSSVKPAVAFDTMPPVNAAGAQTDAETGYVVLRDLGQQAVPLDFEYRTQEVAQFVWEIFYPSLGNADAAALAIKRNGGTAAQRLGFDNGTLSDLASPRGSFVTKRTREQRSVEGHGKTGQTVHAVRLWYSVEILEAA